jgi:hypothetical protein
MSIFAALHFAWGESFRRFFQLVTELDVSAGTLSTITTFSVFTSQLRSVYPNRVSVKGVHFENPQENSYCRGPGVVSPRVSWDYKVRIVVQVYYPPRPSWHCSSGPCLSLEIVTQCSPLGRATVIQAGLNGWFCRIRLTEVEELEILVWESQAADIHSTWYSPCNQKFSGPLWKFGFIPYGKRQTNIRCQLAPQSILVLQWRSD